VPAYPVFLKAAAVVLWGGAMGMSFTRADWRLWGCLVAAAAVASLAALQQALVARSTRIYEAHTQAVLSRPLYRDPTGPLPAVPAQPAAPASGGRIPRGRHATRVSG